MNVSRRNVLGATAGLAAASATARCAVADGPPTPPTPGERLDARTPDGLTRSVRAYGDRAGPEILFVHGLGGCRLSGDRQLAGLAGRFRVVTYDLRGHGDSDKPADAAAYGDGRRWADGLAAVIVSAGPRRPALVGWSLGGLVVGHYLACHGGDRVSGVNLVDAVTVQSADLLGAAALRFAPLLGDADLAVRTAASRDFVAACFASPPPAAEFERMLVCVGMVPAALQRGILPIPGGDRLDAAWAAAARVLVTYGGKDVLTRLAMSQRVLALNSRAWLSVYPNAGHARSTRTLPGSTAN